MEVKNIQNFLKKRFLSHATDATIDPHGSVPFTKYLISNRNSPWESFRASGKESFSISSLTSFSFILFSVSLLYFLFTSPIVCSFTGSKALATLRDPLNNPTQPRLRLFLELIHSAKRVCALNSTAVSDVLVAFGQVEYFS